MNLRRIKKVRDFIAKLPPQACDMDRWQDLARKDSDGNLIGRDEWFSYQGITEYVTYADMKKNAFSCGTVGCIGGWAEIMVNKLTHYELDALSLRQQKRLGVVRARAYLELNKDESEKLFYDFPCEQPDEGWKRWILKRLDGVIRDKAIGPYQSQMAKRSRKG